MVLRSLGACVLFAAVTSAGTTASNPSEVVPRFVLSATVATVDAEVALRVARTPRLARREIRLYLVPSDITASVRSRFDSRLSFIGTVRASRQARIVFTVPPLDAGRYALAYWCRGCLPRGKGIGVQGSPRLRVLAPAAGEGCPTTKPNGNVPPGAPSPWPGVHWHGNGALWVWLRPDGVLVTNALGGEKKIWVAKDWAGGLAVDYRRFDPPSAPLTASVVSGHLAGYDGPSWASRMSFEPGCWQVSGRLDDVRLSFVVQVMLPARDQRR